MKNNNIFQICFLLVSTIKMLAQCPNEIVLFTQSQVDSFSINYPNCSQVKDLTITLSGDISNLSSLRVLSGHQGSIGIWAYGREDVTLDGLEHIDSIDYLGISQSKNIKGLSGVRFINYLFFQNDNNFDLSGLTGLDHITSCNILAPNIESTPTFDLLKIPALKTINSFILTGNFILDGIEKIDTIHRFVVVSNYVLKDLNALSTRSYLPQLTLNAVWTDFRFDGMERIKNLDLLSVRNGKKILSLEGLKNIEKIDFLSIDNVKEFIPENLNELSSIKSINGMFIQSVNGFKSLHGFPASDTLHELFLKKNKQLTDISSLENIKNIGNKRFKWQSEQGISITDNPILSECSVMPVCDMLKTFPDSIKIIKNNGSKCVSVEEVLSHCISSTTNNDIEPKLSFYPNPTFGAFYCDKKISVHYIINSQGTKIKPYVKGDYTFDLSPHPMGVYYIFYTNLDTNSQDISKVVKL